MRIDQKITPFLAFENQAAEAAAFYVSVFPASRVVRSIANPATGEVVSVEVDLAGQRFVMLDAGRDWRFTEAVSFAVSCSSQEEIDELWAKLSAGGEELRCGWLRDRFGVSWQIVPARLPDLLATHDPATARRVMDALLPMGKIDLAALLRAYDGG